MKVHPIDAGLDRRDRTTDEMIGRRGFLSLLAAASAGMVLDPERLLWRPGQKTIFLLPVPKVWTFQSGASMAFSGRLYHDYHDTTRLEWLGIPRDWSDL